MIHITVPTPGIYKIVPLAFGEEGYEAIEILDREAAKVAVFHACQKLPRERIRALIRSFGAQKVNEIREADIPQFVRTLRVFAA